MSNFLFQDHLRRKKYVRLYRSHFYEVVLGKKPFDMKSSAEYSLNSLWLQRLSIFFLHQGKNRSQKTHSCRKKSSKYAVYQRLPSAIERALQSLIGKARFLTMTTYTIYCKTREREIYKAARTFIQKHCLSQQSRQKIRYAEDILEEAIRATDCLIGTRQLATRLSGEFSASHQTWARVTRLMVKAETRIFRVRLIQVALINSKKFGFQTALSKAAVTARRATRNLKASARAAQLAQNRVDLAEASLQILVDNMVTASYTDNVPDFSVGAVRALNRVYTATGMIAFKKRRLRAAKTRAFQARVAVTKALTN